MERLITAFLALVPIAVILWFAIRFLESMTTTLATIPIG